MNSDEGCGLLLLVLVAGLFTLVVMIAIAAGAVIVYVGAHILAAWLVLWVVRDWVVYGWSKNDPEAEREWVEMWLTVVPIFAGIGGYILAGKLAGLLDARTLSPNIKPLLPVISGIGVVVAYYLLYFKVPPRDFKRKCIHPQWPRFVRAQHELLFFSRLKWIEISTKIKLWLAEAKTNSEKETHDEPGV